jgi:hypothetical protein
MGQFLNMRPEGAAMTHDPAIIEAAAQALHGFLGSTPLPQTYRSIAKIVLAAVTPLIEAAVLEEAVKALAPFARAADVYHDERFAPSDEITGRFGKIVRAEELWCLRNLYTRLTRLRARGSRALKPASPSPSADSA